jgi:hypothetical protein
MDTTIISDNAEGRKPRIRSVAYPSYTIQACYELTSKIDKIFTDVVYTPREDISERIGVSGGSFLMQLSSCVQYDLLELKSKDGYKPTAIYKKIKRPLPEENVNDFYIECLNAPELYKKLITDFKDRQLPQVEGLANILDRKYGVVGNASLQAAKVFLKNLENLELISVDNVLKLDGGIAPIEEVLVEDFTKNEEPIQNQPHTTLLLTNSNNENVNRSTNNNQVKEIPIFLKGGREAKIVMPIDFTDEDMLRVSKVINGYLP